MNSSEQFTKYSINTIVTQFIILITSILISIITARVLSPEGRGQLSLILLIPMLSVTFGGMGMVHAINYYASRMPATKLIVNSFILSGLLSVLLVATTLPVVYISKNIFSMTLNKEILFLISIFIPFYLFNYCFISLLQGFYKIVIRNLLNVTHALLNLLLLVILIITLKLGVAGAVTAFVVAILLVTILSAIFVLKEIEIKDIRLESGIIKQLLSFGLKSHIGNVLKDLSYRGDILIISYFLSTASVGYYVIAVTVAETIWRIPDAIGSVLLPRIARMDKSNARAFTPVVSRIVLVPVMLLCLIIFLFREDIICLAFGNEFLPSSPALVILLPGILFLSIWKIIANDLIAQGYPAKYSITSGIALVTMVELDLWLIPLFGINGAALASTISYMAATVSIITIYSRVTGNSFKELLIPARIDLSYYKKLFMGL